MIMINNLLKNDTGKLIISVLIGLGIASLFKKVCVDENCLIIKSHPKEQIEGQIFKNGDKCVLYNSESLKCPSN
jgi:hypothetical protein